EPFSPGRSLAPHRRGAVRVSADTRPLHTGEPCAHDAAGTVILADRFLRLDRGEHLDVPRRLGLSAAARGMAGRVAANHQLVGAAGDRQLHHRRRSETRAPQARRRRRFGGGLYPDRMNAVLIDHVTKTFGSHTAVDDLSLEVPAGSIYGFIGPNGSGKTTTLRMIMRILHPDRGTIRVLGEEKLGAANDRV